MKGEIVAFQLVDVGGTFDLALLARSLADRQPREAPSVGKGTPPYVEFPRPLVVPHSPVTLETAAGPVEAEVTFLYFPIGAVSVRFRIPVEVASLAELRTWNQTSVRLEGQKFGFEAAARLLLERDRSSWEPTVQDRYTSKLLHESYTVFAFRDVGEPPAEFLERHAADVAGLLTGADATRLHEKETREALRKWFSYYADDLTVVDWDAAFLIDPDADYEDLLFVLEIANLQLLQFRAYDDYLDDVIERAYDELGTLFARSRSSPAAREIFHELSLLRIEMAELADEADNITKFLGDWFLARVYQAAQEKFHLNDWRATVDDKLSTLNKLYQLAHEESTSRRMLILEVLIVLLFIIDLGLILYFQVFG